MSAFASGAHVVIVAWLAIGVLNLSANQWGWVQAAALLPNLALMIFAGAWADRYDPAKILGLAQLLLSATYLLLFSAIFSGQLSYVILFAYAVFIGVGNAFIQPVRERLLADLGSETLQQRISVFSIVQFSLQSAGIALASISDFIGLGIVVVIQALLSLLASLLFFSLSKSKIGKVRQLTTTIGDLQRALRFMLRSSGLKQLMVLAAFNGYMHMGVFLVAMPLVATHIYGFSSQQYAALQFLFVLGMVTAHVLLLRAKTLEFPGQGALFSLLYTAFIGFGLAKGPTEFGFYCLIFIWGAVAGNSASRCRLVLQSLVGSEMKGKMMAVYQLMLFGAAPIGALVTGLVSKYLTFQQIFGFMSASSVVLFLAFMFTKALWSVSQEQ